MKSILKIYRRYVATACLLVLFVVFINLAVWLGYAWMRIFNLSETVSNAESIRTGRYRTVAENLVLMEDGYELGESGWEVIRENNCLFWLLLDGSGKVVCEWQRPEEIPEQFSAGDIAAFSKWYLKDYPVAVWRYGEDGLLVFGYPKESLIRYNVSWKTDELVSALGYVQIFCLFNMALVPALALLFGYRFYRSLKPVGEGIDALAEGKRVFLKEKGLTQYLREKINQTSRLLEKREKELERRDTARTEWIAGVSHDIRTPLSLIVGYADELATDPELPKEAREKAGLMRSQSFVIKKLIEDLNLTSKLSYHMQPLRREKYSPAVLLRQVAALLLNGGEIPEAYELDLEVDPALERLSLTGDVQLLTRALQNLLGNSVRHNPGGCTIRLSAQATEEGFCFCVRDNGCGIPEAVQKIVRDEGGDAGPHVMGLRVVKQIICAHGGSLWFAEEGRAVWASVKDLSFPEKVVNLK